MPGAEFKRKAAKFRRTMEALLEEPFADVQKRTVDSCVDRARIAHLTEERTAGRWRST